MIRHCDCGNKLGKKSDLGVCIECYRARHTKRDQPCLLCKQPRSKHKYMYCDYCRKYLFDTGEMAGHMRWENGGRA